MLDNEVKEIFRRCCEMDDDTAIEMLEKIQYDLSWNNDTQEFIRFLALSEQDKNLFIALYVAIEALYDRMR